MYFSTDLGYHGDMNVTERNATARVVLVGVALAVATAVLIEVAAAVVVGAVLSTMNEDGPL